MPKVYRHYRVLAEQLSQHVDLDTQRAVLDGLDYLGGSPKPKVRVRWAREAMERLDTLLDPETRIRVREGCACVLSNEKSIYAQSFRKLRKLYRDDDAYLDEVVKYLNATTPLRRCSEVTREGDTLYSVIAWGTCGCPVLHEGLHGTLSSTWCHCSKGSLLSVYRYVFPERVCHMEIVRTIAQGAEDCSFAVTYRQEV